MFWFRGRPRLPSRGGEEGRMGERSYAAHWMEVDITIYG